ncbi:hypothetical protein D3C76_1234070 [compost metagenome]
MLAQGVGDFVAEDGGDFVVGQLQAVHQAGVENDLAARPAVGVELIALDQIDFPLPLGRIRAEDRRLGNQSIGNHLDALGIATGLVQHSLAARLTHRLLIRLGVHLIDLIRGQHAEHVLLALDTDGATAGGVDRLTAGEQQRCAQCTYNVNLAHRKTP